MTLGTIALWTGILAVSFGGVCGCCLLTVFAITVAFDARRAARSRKFICAEPEDDSFTLAELHSLPDWEV